MNHSLFSRLFGAFMLLVLTVSAAFVAVTFTGIRASYLHSQSADLSALAITLHEQIKPLLEHGHFADVQPLVTRIDQQIHRRITVINMDGSVIADSEGKPQLMENHSGRPEIQEAIKGNVGRAVRYSTTVKQDMLYVAVPLSLASAAPEHYIIRVSMLVSEFNALIHTLKLHLLKTTGIIVLLALAGAIVVSRTLSRSLKELQSAAETMAQGDFSARVKIHSSREIMALGHSFNTMAAKINDLFAEFSGRTEEINTILSAINESLFVVSKDGRILMANAGFKVVCRQSSIEGRYYWEIFREPAFENLIKQSLAGAPHTKGSFEHGGLSYVCGISKLPTGDEYVVLLQDITEEKKLETVKKDLIANVSHELRTPLTAIKGFVETLEDTADSEEKRYLDIISRHTDRLIHIEEDLLLLSEVENPLFTLQRQPQNLVTVINDIIVMFQLRVNDKKLRITLKTDAEQYRVMIDTSKFEQVLINLIDNAVKYTDHGEIIISLHKDTEKIIMEIADTGPGIPSGLLTRIFERFFVADTSRSKKIGGTGLGLSIVKHIVNIHEGSITVSSTIGKGTTFTVTLPAVHQ